MTLKKYVLALCTATLISGIIPSTLNAAPPIKDSIITIEGDQFLALGQSELGNINTDTPDQIMERMEKRHELTKKNREVRGYQTKSQLIKNLTPTETSPSVDKTATFQSQQAGGNADLRMIEAYTKAFDTVAEGEPYVYTELLDIRHAVVLNNTSDTLTFLIPGLQVTHRKGETMDPKQLLYIVEANKKDKTIKAINLANYHKDNWKSIIENPPEVDMVLLDKNTPAYYVAKKLYDKIIKTL